MQTKSCTLFKNRVNVYQSVKNVFKEIETAKTVYYPIDTSNHLFTLFVPYDLYFYV